MRLRHALLALLLCPALFAQTPTELQQGFASPPPSARPQTWWHWMNGNVSKEGITLDLEAMQRVGIGGVEIFNVGEGIPAGPVRFLSDDWRALVKHAVTEADRLGLEVALHNCAGWSSSGGPWVKPEQAMQMVTWSEARVSGPGPLAKPLPQPPTRRGFYRDTAVLVFPTPPAEAETMADRKPAVTTSLTGVELARALDGNPDSAVTLTVAQGRPRKFLRGSHARSILEHKLGGSVPGRWLLPMTRAIPEDLAIPYPADDVFWLLCRLDPDAKAEAGSRSSGD